MKALFAKLSALVCIAAVSLASCEKPYVGIEPDTSDEPANVTFCVTGFEQIPFDDPVATRAASDISQVCSRINLVVYDGETKVKSVVQKKGDADYGTVAMTLPQGSYKVAIIGHSTSASATVTSLEKISFTSNLLSDTFSYYTEINVGDEAQTHDVTLRRVVAMFRLVQTKAFPQEIKRLKFYYTGGSSTLSAITGYGSVNSKQTVNLDVASGQKQFEVYTIPHAETGVLRMTISALDASETVLKECVLEEVPVQRNRITVYTGDLFDGSSAETGEDTFRLKVETAWDGEDNYEF